MTDKTIFMRLTKKGNELLEKSYLNGTPFLTKDWELKLGTGYSENYMELKDLNEPIYDKTSSDYTGFIVHKEHIKYGRCAQFEIPLSLQGSVIREIGFFNPEGELVLYGRIYIDYTKMTSAGVKQCTTMYVSIHAVPPEAIDLTINISNAFPTNEQMQTQINLDMSNHNTDPDAHLYLARINGNINQKFSVADADDPSDAVNLNQLKQTLESKKKVINLGNISGSVTLEYDKLYTASLIGDTTIILAQPENDLELYEVFFNFINTNGAYNLYIPSNTAFNNGVIPNFKVKNQQRLVFETLNRGETVNCYHMRRG